MWIPQLHNYTHHVHSYGQADHELAIAIITIVSDCHNYYNTFTMLTVLLEYIDF